MAVDEGGTAMLLAEGGATATTLTVRAWRIASRAWQPVRGDWPRERGAMVEPVGKRDPVGEATGSSALCVSTSQALYWPAHTKGLSHESQAAHLAEGGRQIRRLADLRVDELVVLHVSVHVEREQGIA